MKIRLLELERELTVSKIYDPLEDKKMPPSWSKLKGRMPCWRNTSTPQGTATTTTKTITKNDTTTPLTPVLPTPSSLWTRSCDSTQSGNHPPSPIEVHLPQSHPPKPQNTRSSAEFFLHIRCSFSKVATKDHRRVQKNVSSVVVSPHLAHATWSSSLRYTKWSLLIQSRRTH